MSIETLRAATPVDDGAEASLNEARRTPAFDRRATDGRVADRRAASRRELSVVVPTFNEAENLPILLGQLAEVLHLVDYEVIVVDDDSPDGTWQVADELALDNPRVRCMRRVGERGLSSAVMAGFSVASGEVLAVMDADLQHDSSILPDLLEPIRSGAADIVVASREAEGGGYGDWSRSRRTLSVAGASLARTMTGTPVTDPMSGFFAVSRARLEEVAPDVNPRGFKILLEVLARGDSPRVAEVGYTFGLRQHGETKLTTSVAFSYLVSLTGLVTGRMLSATVSAYLFVGAFGVLIQLALLGLLAAVGVEAGPVLALEASVLATYWLHNRVTFSPDRRSGRRLISGLVPFHLVTAHGVIVQLGVVSALGGAGLASAPLAHRLLGMALATAGNYALNRHLTWQPHRRLVTLERG